MFTVNKKKSIIYVDCAGFYKESTQHDLRYVRQLKTTAKA